MRFAGGTIVLCLALCLSRAGYAEDTTDGEKLFGAKCAMCHSAGTMYPGTMAIKQSGGGDKALPERTDIDADLVTQVVHNGLGSMPALPITYVSDQDLQKIATWLGQKSR